MSILHDFSQLRKAAADLTYIYDNGLLGDLSEWLGTVSPGAKYDPDRRHRVEYGKPPRIAELLERFTGADYDVSLLAAIAALEPTGQENRCAEISQFAALHRKHGKHYYAKLYEHLSDPEERGNVATSQQPEAIDKRSERAKRLLYGSKRKVVA